MLIRVGVAELFISIRVPCCRVGVAELFISIRVPFDRVGQEFDFRVNAVLLRVELFCCEWGSRSFAFHVMPLVGVGSTPGEEGTSVIVCANCNEEIPHSLATGWGRSGWSCKNAKAITTDSVNATESPCL